MTTVADTQPATKQDIADVRAEMATKQDIDRLDAGLGDLKREIRALGRLMEDRFTRFEGRLTDAGMALAGLPKEDSDP